MKKIYFIYLIFLSAIFFSCTKEPVANFTTDKATYNEGDVINISNLSEDADNYVWVMPGGITSTEKNTQWQTGILANESSATFKLIAYSKNGKKSDEIQKTITIVRDCEKNNTGTYYFKNSTSGTLFFTIDGGTDFAVLSGQNSETLILIAGSHSYYITDNTHVWQGNIQVVQCQNYWSNITL